MSFVMQMIPALSVYGVVEWPNVVVKNFFVGSTNLSAQHASIVHWLGRFFLM